MIVRSARWGVLLLAASAALLAGAGAAAVTVGPLPPPGLAGIILPLAGLLLGVLVLFAGHVSYPRVQNLRVYLAGYSIGLQSILYVVFVGLARYYIDAIPTVPRGYREVVYLLGILLAGACTLLPAFPTYRSTRILTLVLVGLQATLLTAVRFLPASFGFLERLEPDRLLSPPAIAAVGLATAVVLVNALLRPQTFYLRGAFSGIALLGAGAWVLPSLLTAVGYGPVSPDFVALLYVSCAPFFLAGSILAHILARMEHRVSYDPLLQIYNREFCNRILAEQSSINTRPPLCVMMIDIDHFKQVNDTWGHQAGDRILFNVAQTVQKSVVPEGVVCRYGGEELIVFIPGRTGRDIVPLAQRLRASVEGMETSLRSKRISVTVSIGISDRRSARHSLRQVVRAADKALYIAKENGRNQIRFVRIKEAAR